MPRYRLSRLAEADLVGILAASNGQWGAAGGHRYAALLAAVLRKIAAEPEGPTTRRRDDCGQGSAAFTSGMREVVIRRAG